MGDAMSEETIDRYFEALESALKADPIRRDNGEFVSAEDFMLMREDATYIYFKSRVTRNYLMLGVEDGLIRKGQGGPFQGSDY